MDKADREFFEGLIVGAILGAMTVGGFIVALGRVYG